MCYTVLTDTQTHHFPEKIEKFPPEGDSDTLTRMDTQMPGWLVSSPPSQQSIQQTQLETTPAPQYPVITEEQQAIIEQGRLDRIARQEKHYPMILDAVLDHVASGEPVKTWFQRDPRDLDRARFLRWVRSDPERLRQYRDAQAVAGEVIFDDMVVISDASDSLEDVARSTLRVNTRWKALAVLDRERFGEKKQIEQTVTIDMGAAMLEARERVSRSRTIEGEARRLDE